MKRRRYSRKRRGRKGRKFKSRATRPYKIGFRV